MSRSVPTHVAFCDESCHNDGRYRSIGVVSLRVAELARVETYLREVLNHHGVTSELKWSKLGDGVKQRAAYDMVSFAVEECRRRNLSVDVIGWDCEDSRHKVKGRDDQANLGRMYFHVLKHVLRERSSQSACWLVHPDTQSLVDWRATAEYLEFKKWQEVPSVGLFYEQDSDSIRRYFERVNIEERHSATNPLIQIADIFAGMLGWSKPNYETYKEHCETTTHQTSLFVARFATTKAMSNGNMAKCKIIKRMIDLCRTNRLGVSIDTEQRLKSWSGSCPINFWWYVPQREYDIAPVRRQTPANIKA